MSKKPDTASALASILKAKRGGDDTVEATAAATAAPVVEKPVPPSPAPLAAAPETRSRGGKSSDKANYSQFSVYLKRATRKKVGRRLDDMDSELDFSDLVEELLEQWLKATT